MQTDLSVALELTEETSMQTKVSLSSFIEKNNWFKGTVYLLTVPDLPVTNKTLLEIRMIYPQVEVLNISDDPLIAKTLNSIKSKSKESFFTLSECLKLGALLIDESVLYLSQRSLFLSDVSFVIKEDKLSISQIMSTDSSSIFYIDRSIDKSIILTNVCNLLISEESLFSKRKIDVAFSSEFKKLTSINFIPHSKIANSTNYLDRYFSKLKVTLDELSCIHFEEKTLNNPLYNKINQIWLHKARGVKLLTNKPVNLNRREVLNKTANLEYIKSTVKLTSIEKNFKVTVIIPAHKAAEYIEECLDSIVSQTTSAELEIIVGVDNCQNTLTHLKQIKHKYSNLRVFYSNKSLGAYVMRNTLSEIAKNDNLLFFDADDIMMPSMVSTILRKYNRAKPIRFKYINFNHGENHLSKKVPHPKPSHGVFFIPKNLFHKIGGFQNWPCGADTEFMKRCAYNRIQDAILNLPLFHRRIHATSLTQNPETGYRSSIRSQINLKIKNTIDWSIPISRVTSKLIEI